MFKKYDKFTWWTPKPFPRLVLYLNKPMTKLQIIWQTKGAYFAYLKFCFVTIQELSKLPPEELKTINDKMNQQRESE